MAQYTKPEALNALFPKAKWKWVGEDYSGIEWDSDNTDSKPTEKQITDKLTAMETEYTNNKYQRDRKLTYPDIGDQLDNLYKDILAGKVDSTGEFAKAIKATKDKYPKP